MKLDLQPFEQLKHLSTADMVELVNTVGETLNARKDSRNAKMVMGTLLVNFAVLLLESSECDVEITISRPEWDKAIKYTSGALV